jgi:zinc/manganese transport system substrate-binding protein
MNGLIVIMPAYFLLVIGMFFMFKFSCHSFISYFCLVTSLSFFSVSTHGSAKSVIEESNVPIIKVVTTFSILADMVQQIGGEHISVHTLVDWDEDAHVFQPSPDDVKQIADADLLVLNGLGFEGWLARLLSAAEYSGPSVEATKGIALIHIDLDHDDHAAHKDEHGHDQKHKANVYDPHAWHSLKAALVYLENISQALIKVDPINADYYSASLNAYSEKLKKLDETISSNISDIPDEKRRMVVPHNAFAYLARDYGLHIHSLQGVSTDSEASAADLAKIVRLIRSLKVKAIFTETISDKRLIRVVESETDATIEGALVSGALSRELAPTYLEMMEYNSRLIIDALTKN